MSASPWMPLYIADYLADTAHLSAAEHGAYLLLIMHYWRAGKLPNDEKQLARIARMNAREWANSRDVLASFFDKEWRHKRIESEILKSTSKSHARAEAGARGGTAKSLKNNNAGVAIATILPEQNTKQNDALALASSSQSHTECSSLRSEQEVSLRSTSVGSPENYPSESQETAKPRNAYPSEFELLWHEWPANPNESKKTAFERWRKLSKTERDDCFDGAMAQGLWLEAETAKRPGRDPPRIHLSTFISERRWETLLKSEFNRYGRNAWKSQNTPQTH